MNQYPNQTTLTKSFTAGTYSVTLNVLNAQGCAVQFDTIFEVLQDQRPTLDSPQPISILQSTCYFQDLSTGSVAGWNWDFGDLESASDQNPTHSYSAGGEYNVQQFITDINGCTDTAVQNVIVKDEILIFIPDAVSPNGDGVNDVFRVTGLGYDNIKIQIFNRWGERIYESDNFAEWDATNMGKKVQMGSYIYIISITDNRGRKYYKKSHIYILR